MPGAENPQAFNRYAYTFNNPIRYNDPSGHCPICIAIAAYILKTAAESAVDTAIDYGISQVTGEQFDAGSSFASNFAVNGLTAGIGGDVKHAAKGADLLVTAAKHADGGVTVANAMAKNVDNILSLPSKFSRTIDKAPGNLGNYTLRPSDVAGNGRGLSTIGDTVDPKIVLAETGKPRLVQIPASDVPEGLRWIQTPGTYGKPVLDNNHWELWHPSKFSELGPEGYRMWWNDVIAPSLAERAKNWTPIKP